MNSLPYRHFRRLLFHESLSTIFETVKPYMTTPDIVKCPDLHFRHAIYGLGPYIADYPEQVLLAAVVQGWCVRYVSLSLDLYIRDLNSNRCIASPKNLDQQGSLRRSCEHTASCVEALTHTELWNKYGIISDVLVSLNVRYLF